MVNVIVTPHAVKRFMERIGGNEDEAFAALSGHTVDLAAQFGARAVRIGHCRALMQFDSGYAVVITVIPIGDLPPQSLRPQSWGGPPPSRDELPHLRKEPR